MYKIDLITPEYLEKEIKKIITEYTVIAPSVDKESLTIIAHVNLLVNKCNEIIVALNKIQEPTGTCVCSLKGDKYERNSD